MRSLVAKLAVLVFFIGGSAFADGESYCWGVDIDRYEGTGTWESYHDSGELELVLVIENRGDEENWWLTVKYREGKKKQLYFSRMLDDDPDNQTLYGLDGAPVGETRARRGETDYFLDDSTVVRVGHEGAGEILSGRIEMNGVARDLRFVDVELSFVKSILNGC